MTRNDQPQRPGIPFCIAGGHPVPDGTAWELIRASCDGPGDGSGNWFADPTSPAKIVVCADHVEAVR